MAFDVYLHSFTKEPNSTAQPSDAGLKVDCVSNDRLDIISPVLPLKYTGAAWNPSGYNYCKVPAFNRYYWIDRWAFVGGLWTAYCSVDPLASWKSGIGATSAYVLRAAADYDGDLIDNLYPTEGGPTVDITSISTGWWSNSDLSYSSGTFVVGLINELGSTDYVYMSPTTFVNFAAAAFSDNFFNSVKDQTWLTKAIFDPMQYLASVTWFPMLPTGGSVVNAKLGYWTVKDANDNPISCTQAPAYVNRTMTAITLPKHPQAAARGPWVNNAPLTTYTLEVMPFGRISLDPALLYNASKLYMEMTVDYISGSAILRVYAGSASTDPCIYQQTAQLGVQVQVSQVLRDTFGGLMGVTAGVAGLASGNIIGGLTSAITSAVNMAYPDVTTSGVNSGFAGLYGQWRLYSKFYTLAAEDLAHRGRPLCQVRQLSTLSGYQLCTNTDVKLPATKAELDMIRGYLESGYYYE